MAWIYIAHPHGGMPENKNKVEQIIRDLVKIHPDYLFISPINTFGYLYNDVSYEKGMEYCLELLDCCNELWLCEGWETSKGCAIEKEHAEKYDIPIKYLGR